MVSRSPTKHRAIAQPHSVYQWKGAVECTVHLPGWVQEGEQTLQHPGAHRREGRCHCRPSSRWRTLRGEGGGDPDSGSLSCASDGSLPLRDGWRWCGRGTSIVLSDSLAHGHGKTADAALAQAHHLGGGGG